MSPKQLDNSHQAFEIDYDSGNMDGWNLVYVSSRSCPKCAYEYVNPKQIAPYWTLAGTYGLADHMFPNGNERQLYGSSRSHPRRQRRHEQRKPLRFPESRAMGMRRAGGNDGAVVDRFKTIYIQSGPFPCSNQFPSSGLLQHSARFARR